MLHCQFCQLSGAVRTGLYGPRHRTMTQSDLPRRLEDYSPEIQLLLTDLYRRTTARLTAVVERHGRGPGLSLGIAEERIAILAAEMQPVIDAMTTAGTPVAFARGCGSCCTLTIQVSPVEVFALRTYLERNLSPEDLAGLMTRAGVA